MNGYLRSKCSSEQQLLNELAKLLGAKDVTSRKMADVLRALTFFYTSAGRGSRIPLSLLSGLCTLLPQLKDKKEITLLKDEHQRIARIALCLLSRLIDQFEIQKEMTTGSNLSQDQSVDPAEQVLANFLLTLETAVMTPSGMLLPRQRATLRVYAQLCRIFLKREQLVTYTAALLQQSPVLTYAENHVDAKGKRLPPPVPAQFGAVAGACHAVRFNTEPDDQVFVANKLAQLAFMVPAGTASRHAAKTLLSLLTSPVLNEGRPSNAITVAKAIELYLLKARPRTLLGGDSLTSVYLLRLCGQMARLPAHHQQQQEIPATNDSQHFNITSTLLETSSDIAPEKAHDRNSALQGFLVSHALSIQLQEYLVDVIQAAVADDSSTKAGVVPAVLLVAVEETLRGTSPEDSFRQQPNWGSKCIFELVAAALLPLLPAPQDPARLLCSTVTLHRVCRAVQFVAERLDAAVLHFGVATGQKMEIPTYLSQLTLRVHSLTEHSNAFIACEALRGFVWLLPRYSINTEQNGSIENHWTSIFWQLEALPLGRVQPERRAAIAWTIFRRCVTTLKSYGYEVEKPLLLGCLRVVLAWFRVRPCVWHAALLTAIWHTTLRECLVAPLGEAVFASINEVLDYQCSPTDNGATDSLIVKQSTLQFLSNREGCLKHVVRREEWCRPLILRLTKQVLLENSTSQRLGFRALSQLGDEADAQGLTSLAQQAKAILSFTEKLPRQAQRKGLTTGDEFQNQPFSIHDELLPGVKAQGGALDDPFSDFRAPDGAIASANKALEDPFADPIECATTSDVFNWNSATSTTSKVTATVSTSITDLQIPADHSFGDSTWYNPTAFNETKTEAFGESSQFSAWGDESDIQNIPPQRTIQETLFGNFTASETTSFDDWGGGGTTEPQQEGFIANEDFSGSFDAAISTPAMTTESESDIAGQTAQTDEASPADVPDVPIADEDPVAITSPDTTAAAGMVSDAQSEAANFSTAETTSFDDWGGGGTTEPQQEGFIANEDFSGSFDAAISTPAMTTESESDIAGQTAQTDEASPADVPDVPIADEDPVAIASPDTTAAAGMVSDAQSEAANFSTAETTSFDDWGGGGTTEPQQEGFIANEDFSGSFDAAISTPAMTTESESDIAGQTAQTDEASPADVPDVPIADEDPVAIASPDTTAAAGMVSDAQSEAANFSTAETTSFDDWGGGGTTEPQQEGFIANEDFSGSFDAAISTPAMTTESESDIAGQTAQTDEASPADVPDVPIADEDPVAITSPDTTAAAGMVSDAQSEAANFSTAETTSFDDWGGGGTTEPQQEGFIANEDFSGSFDAAISTPAMTTESESDIAGQTAQTDEASPADVPDVPIADEDPVAIASPDTTAAAGMVSDAQSEAANFSTAETTSFDDWGGGGTTEPQQEGFIANEDFSGSFDAAISTPAMTTESESDIAGQTAQTDEASPADVPDVPIADEDPVAIASPDTTAAAGMVSDAQSEAANFSTAETTSFDDWGGGGTTEPQQEGFIANEDFSGSFDAAISTPAMTTESESDIAGQTAQTDEASPADVPDVPIADEDPVAITSPDTTAAAGMVSDAQSEAANFSTAETTSFDDWGGGGTTEPQQEGFIANEDFSGSFDAAISTPAMTTESESDIAGQTAQTDEASPADVPDVPIADEDPVAIASPDTTAAAGMVSDAQSEAANFSTAETTSFDDWGGGGTTEPQQEGFIANEDFSGSFDAAISTPAMTTESESDIAGQTAQTDEASPADVPDVPIADEDPVAIASPDTTAAAGMVSDAQSEAANFSTAETTSFDDWGGGGTTEPQQEGFIANEDFSGSFDAAISTPAMTTESESDIAGQTAQTDEASPADVPDVPIADEDPVAIASPDTTAAAGMVSDAQSEAANFSTAETTSFDDWGGGGTTEPQQEGFIANEDFSGSFDAAISTPAMTTESESDIAGQTAQTDEASPADVPDVPIADEDPVAITSPDTTAAAGMVSDAQSEAANFSTAETTSFDDWGGGGTTEPQQEGFIANEDFSGSFDAAISTPAMTTESESDIAGQTAQTDEASPADVPDVPIADEDPVAIASPDTTAAAGMVSDAQSEAANFSTAETTSFDDWGGGGTTEPQQEGFIANEDFSGSFDAAISTPAMTTESESDIAGQTAQTDEASPADVPDVPIADEDPVAIASPDTTAAAGMVSDAQSEAANFSTAETTSFDDWGGGGTTEPQQEGFIANEDFSGSFDAAISTPAMTTESESDIAGQTAQTDEASPADVPDVPIADEDPVAIASPDTTAAAGMVSDAQSEAANFSTAETTSFDDWGGGGTTEPQQEGFIANEDFSGSFDAAISTPAMTTESESDIAGQTAQTDEASPADVPDVPIADEDPVAIASPDTTAAAGMVSDAQSEAANFSTAETTSFDDWGGGGTTEPQQEGFIANEDFSGSFDAAISTPAMTTESESDIAGQTAQTDEASPADVPDVPIADEDPVAIASPDTTAAAGMVSDAQSEAANFSTAETTSFDDWGGGGTTEPQQEGFIANEDFSGSFDAAISTPAMTTESESDIAGQTAQTDEASPADVPDVPIADEDPVAIASPDTTAAAGMVSDAQSEAANFSTAETTSFDDWGGGGTTEPQQEGFIANEDFSGSFDAAISTPAMTTESESDIAGQTAQTDEASPADVPDVPIADEDPVAIASPDTTAAAGMVSDAQSEAANFSTAETTSFDDWGGGGTTEPQQEGFIANEDFSGSFDAAISTPAMTTESESDIAGQTAQTDEASPADVPDVPIADEDPVAIASPDTTAAAGMVSDAQSEAANFSTAETTSFDDWGGGGTTEPQQEGFIANEDFSGSFDAAISTPAMTTESESDIAGQTAQTDEASPADVPDVPIADEDPVAIASPDTTAAAGMVSDAQSEAANFSTAETTSFDDWGGGGTTEPQQEGFIANEDFSGSFDAAISTPAMTTESESDIAGQTAQIDEASPADVPDVPIADEDPVAIASLDFSALTPCADLDFDDIFGETGGFAKPSVEFQTDNAIENTIVPTGIIPVDQCDDLEFNDIFGDNAGAGKGAFPAPGGSGAYGDMISTTTEHGSKEKDLNASGNEDRTASGIEVRSGTPASDFYASFTTDSLKQ